MVPTGACGGARDVGAQDRPAEPSSRNYEDVAVLNYDHEREPEAMSLVAPSLAKTAGELADEVLAGRRGSRAPRRCVRATAPPRGRRHLFRHGGPFRPRRGAERRSRGPSGPASLPRRRLAGGAGPPGRPGAARRADVCGSRRCSKTRQDKFYGYGAFHGYWVEDLAQIEPRFGTVEKLAELSDALHRRGMRLILDMVLNHVAFDSPLLAAHPEWFHHEGNLEDCNDPEQLTRRDVKGLPDLAQEKEEVYRYLLDTSLAWIERVHPDGFRLDAVKHVPLSFWSRYDDALHASAGKDFELLGEELDGDPAALARVQRDGHFDAMFDFPLHFALVDVFCKDQPPERLGAVLSNDRMYPDPDALVTLVDNHDLPRILSSCGGDVDRVSASADLSALRARHALSHLRDGVGVDRGERAGQPRRHAVFTGGPAPAGDSAVAGAPAGAPGAAARGAAHPARFRRCVRVCARVAPEEAAVIVVNHRDGPARVELPPELAALSWPDLAGGAGPRPASSSLRRSPGRWRRWWSRREAQWRTGARRRDVKTSWCARRPRTRRSSDVAGSGPELGSVGPPARAGAAGRPTWRRARSSLPVGAVVEFRKAVELPPGGATPRWEAGDNHVAFVKDEAGPLRVELAWR